MNLHNGQQIYALVSVRERSNKLGLNGKYKTIPPTPSQIPYYHAIDELQACEVSYWLDIAGLD